MGPNFSMINKVQNSLDINSIVSAILLPLDHYIEFEEKAKKGRGHWGHAGRKGKRGGSRPSKGAISSSWNVSDEQYDRFFSGIPREEIDNAFSLAGSDGEMEVKMVGKDLSIHVLWKDRETGEKVGECDRTLREFSYPAMRGRPPEHHKIWIGDRLFLEPQFQDRGAATKMFDQQVALARRAGFTEMRTTAAGTIGRYAWAKKGYGYAVEPERKATMATKKFQKWAEHNGIGKPSKGWPTFKSVGDVATYRGDVKFTPRGSFKNKDVPKGLEMDLGKAFMLDMSDFGHGEWQALVELKSP